MTRRMKDSGIEWIGEIPEDWEVIKVKYLSKLNGRIGWQGLTSNEYQDEGPYLITGTDFKNGKIDWSTCVHITNDRYEEAQQIQIQNGDLLITKDGTVGKVAIVCNLENKASLNSGVLLIRSLKKEHYETKFLYYVLVSEVFCKWFDSTKTGNSTIIHLYQEKFKEFNYPFPRLAEQVSIATYLDNKCSKIDETIEKEKQVIEKLKAYKQSVITEAVTKGLDPDAPIKDSGIEWIGDIPQHWKVTTMKSLVDVRDGTHDTPLYFDKSEYTFPLVTSKDFENGNINFENVKWILKEDYINICARSKVEQGDVLMSMIGGNIGKTVIVKENAEFAIKNVALFKTGENQSLATIINYYLQCNLLKIQIDLKSRGGAQDFLGLGDIRNLVFFSIPKVEQDEIANHLDNKCSKIDSTIAQKETLIQKLTEYKKSLIYECVTGKIDCR